MTEKNRFSKPVAFNKRNEEDQKILKHVSRRNFSGYVKKLILEDIKRKEEKKAAVKSTKEDVVKIVEEIKQPEPIQETTAETISRLSERIKKQKPSNLPGPKKFI